MTTSTKTRAAYGSWPSPLTCDALLAGALRLGDLQIADGIIWWQEGRPQEGGRGVVVRQAADGSRQDMTPKGFGVRSKAHEYGGGAFCVLEDELFFVNDPDQQIWRQRPGEKPQALSHASGNRFADLTADPLQQRLLAVEEDHSDDGEAINRLVGISLHDGSLQVLAEGADFYSSPAPSPDGTQLAWLSWSHPYMPWDSTRLWLADLDEQGMPSNTRCIAGGDEESVFQPQWSPLGELHWASDSSNWWNLYRLRNGQVQCVLAREAEFAMPQWVFAMSTYGFRSDGGIVSAANQGGRWSLWQIDSQDQALEIPGPWTLIEGLRVEGDTALFKGSSPQSGAALIRLDLNKTEAPELLCQASTFSIDPACIAEPQAIEVPCGEQESTHAYFYPPTHGDYQGLSDELPPLLVRLHGGPTSCTSPAFDSKIQYWTSRGFAVADINYRGSTGFGRTYHRSLYKRWGLADVEDCVAVASHLADQGLVDRKRLAISGGSAGGFTVLAALTFHDTFSAGASHYGISDLEALAQDTHKFESRYMDYLVGPWPETSQTYQARSPIHHVDQLNAAVVFFQGLEDKVVPPNQAQVMVEALKVKQLPVAYVPFEGEGHGFRRSENIRTALEGELYFYGRVFGFEPAGDPQQIDISGL